ncbi:hypothetical protein ACWC10_08150, partial [Streptomyces sp. NPDC001595]
GRHGGAMATDDNAARRGARRREPGMIGETPPRDAAVQVAGRTCPPPTRRAGSLLGVSASAAAAALWLPVWALRAARWVWVAPALLLGAVAAVRWALLDG